MADFKAQIQFVSSQLAVDWSPFLNAPWDYVLGTHLTSVSTSILHVHWNKQWTYWRWLSFKVVTLTYVSLAYCLLILHLLIDMLSVVAYSRIFGWWSLLSRVTNYSIDGKPSNKEGIPCHFVPFQMMSRERCWNMKDLDAKMLELDYWKMNIDLMTIYDIFSF